MSSAQFPTEDRNPYAAPLAEISVPAPEFEQADSADESLRLKHLTHENRVRSIGDLGFVGMLLYGLSGAYLVVVGIFLTVRAVTEAREHWKLEVGLTFCGLGIVGVAMAFGCCALARGLRRLRSWARWTWVVLLSLPIVTACVAAVVCAVLGVMGKIEVRLEELPVVLVGFAASVLFPGGLLYLLLCRESRLIFTPEYRAVVARTPHIKYQDGRWTRWITMLLMIAVIAILVVMFLSISG